MYNFLPDLSLSTHLNARKVLGNTDPRTYFARPHNLAFHDLTKQKNIHPSASQLLGLSLKFIPTPKYTSGRDIFDQIWSRFERDAHLQIHFSGADYNFQPTRLYLKSTWRAPLPPPEIDNRLCSFEAALCPLFKRRKGTTNLTPFQQRIFKTLTHDDSIIYAHSDKNLGPVAIELTRYVQDGLSHLSDSSTYTLLTETEALQEDNELRASILQWCTHYYKQVPLQVRKYIRQNLDDTKNDPFGYFYLLYKIHKPTLSTRPVCSDCVSTLHALGQYVNETLQPIMKAQNTYFKDSFALKEILDSLLLPSNASLFTYNAISMYTKIDTKDCIERLSNLLWSPDTQGKFPHYSPEALISAINIVMHNNRMRFGDIVVRQITGIAMGMSPAPTIANLYIAAYEQSHLPPYFPKPLLFLKRFIDDGFGIWLHDADPEIDEKNWLDFKNTVNQSGLTWTFSTGSPQATFLDMTVSIESGRLITKLFKKPGALQLFIPPRSCHPPGVITGLIMGNILRIFHLCSQAQDITKELNAFFEAILARGYQASTIKPIFEKAINNAKNYIKYPVKHRERKKLRQNELSTRERLFFHVPFHPNNPPSQVLQHLWHTKVYHPPGKLPLNKLTNREGETIFTNQLVIAYSRAPNLGNLLSYQKIDGRSGPKVSSYMIRHK